jgi:hypothetical protein
MSRSTRLLPSFSFLNHRGIKKCFDLGRMFEIVWPVEVLESDLSRSMTKRKKNGGEDKQQVSSGNTQMKFFLDYVFP